MPWRPLVAGGATDGVAVGLRPGPSVHRVAHHVTTYAAGAVPAPKPYNTPPLAELHSPNPTSSWRFAQQGKWRLVVGFVELR